MIRFSFQNDNFLDKVLIFLKLSFIVLLKNFIKTRININKNKNKKNRMLEIGPGIKPITGFETLNVIDSKKVDYIMNISKKLSFRNETFDLIYASHVIEHVPWYFIEKTIEELYRVLKKGGKLEVFVPDGLKICKTLVEFEEKQIDNIHKDGWYRFNKEKDPCVWASGRIFTYGDGSNNLSHHNWHRTLFTPRYLIKIFRKAGFEQIEILDSKDVRGHDHGWINLGIRGVK